MDVNDDGNSLRFLLMFITMSSKGKYCLGCKIKNTVGQNVKGIRQMQFNHKTQYL